MDKYVKLEDVIKVFREEYELNFYDYCKKNGSLGLKRISTTSAFIGAFTMKDALEERISKLQTIEVEVQK